MWSPTISPDVLQHSGIKDMKWGRRRFQNPDGSLTPAGRLRYGVGGPRNSVGNQWADAKGARSSSGRPQSKSRSKIDGKDAKEAAKAAGQISNESARLARKASEKGYRNARDEIDLSGMSNKELNKAIHRMSLEKQYKDLALNDVRTGWDVAGDILDVTGSVLAIGVSAATIYTLLHKR